LNVINENDVLFTLSIIFFGQPKALLQWVSMYAYHSSSLCNCTSSSEQKHCTFAHGGGAQVLLLHVFAIVEILLF